jgi:chemotaxis protein CheD
MLPLWNGCGLATPRYGNIAIMTLIKQLEEHGCSSSRMQAKVFGGAAVLSMNSSNKITSVGERNITVAKSILAEHSIPIVASCVGGVNGYKLIYKTYSGEVLLKRLATMSERINGIDSLPDKGRP